MDEVLCQVLGSYTTVKISFTLSVPRVSTEANAQLLMPHTEDVYAEKYCSSICYLVLFGTSCRNVNSAGSPHTDSLLLSR